MKFRRHNSQMQAVRDTNREYSCQTSFPIVSDLVGDAVMGHATGKKEVERCSLFGLGIRGKTCFRKAGEGALKKIKRVQWREELSSTKWKQRLEKGLKGITSLFGRVINPLDNKICHDAVFGRFAPLTRRRLAHQIMQIYYILMCNIYNSTEAQYSRWSLLSSIFHEFREIF